MSARRAMSVLSSAVAPMCLWAAPAAPSLCNGYRCKARPHSMSCWERRRSSCVRQRGDDPMRVIFFVAAATAAVLIAVRPAQAQTVPDLNVDPVCHGIAQQAADPSEKGGPDLAFSKCVKSEQAMRQKLVNEWSMFLPSEKTNCIGAETAGTATYTDLISCLEMARDARQLNQGK